MAAIDVVVAATAEDAARLAAHRMAAEMEAAVAGRGQATVALSGGRTPAVMFDELAADDIAWSAVHLFQVDERVAPAGPDRNLTVLRDHLVSKVDGPATNLHPMPVDGSDLDAGADDYGRTLASVCGVPPVLDVVHLGLGGDGHTASLFPGDRVLDEVDRDVAVSGEHAGHRRMTLTFPALARARRIVWLVTGAEKADALRGLVNGAASPAGRLRRSGDVAVVDRTAVGS